MGGRLKAGRSGRNLTLAWGGVAMRRARGIGAGLAGAVLVSAVLAIAAAAALAQPEDIGPRVPMIASGAPIGHQDESTEVGRPLLLFHYVHIDGHCGPTPMAIRLATPPAHGAVAFADGEERPFSEGHPMFGPADPRAHCGNRLAATRDAVYTPAPGFAGHDALAVEFTENGTSFTDTIDVSVR
jgi:hypothetical protein